MTKRFQDQVVIITGAASGIGAGTVSRFRDEGAHVIAADVRGNLLQSVAHKTGAVPHLCDVTNKSDIESLFDMAKSYFGRLNVVVNAAGIVIADDVGSITDDGWDQTFAVNLTGMMRVCRTAIPHLIATGGGAIVNISSVAAFNASPGMASYAASKAGVIALTRALANQYGSYNIRANSICPGWIRTPMSEAETRDMAAARGVTVERIVEDLQARLALKRLGVPDEVASVVAFLASNDAAFITGASVVVDGGAKSPATARAI